MINCRANEGLFDKLSPEKGLKKADPWSAFNDFFKCSISNRGCLLFSKTGENVSYHNAENRANGLSSQDIHDAEN